MPDRLKYINVADLPGSSRVAKGNYELVVQMTTGGCAVPIPEEATREEVVRQLRNLAELLERQQRWDDVRMLDPADRARVEIALKQATAQGTLSHEEVAQLHGAGVPVMDHLKELTGFDYEEIKSAIEARRLNSTIVRLLAEKISVDLTGIAETSQS